MSGCDDTPAQRAPAYASENDARAALLDACRAMNAAGINQGKSGNVSLRWHRGGGDGMLISPSGLAYDLAGIDDVVWLALPADPAVDAPRVAGERAPSSEWRMHAALHEAHDAGAVVHTHSTHASALSCLPEVQRRGIPAFHYMIAMAGGDDLRCARYATFGTQALSQAALEAIDGRRACLLANHGVLAYGDTLAAAFALAQEVETLARMYAIALSLAPALGDPVLLDDAQMAQVRAQFAGYGR